MGSYVLKAEENVFGTMLLYVNLEINYSLLKTFFFNAIKTIQIPDDQKLVSFDVKSLFTSIPPQPALDCTDNAIKSSTAELSLTTDDIMDLLNFCLTSPYFQYKGNH